MSKKAFVSKSITRILHASVLAWIVSSIFSPANAELLANNNFEGSTLSPWNVNTWGGQMTALQSSPGQGDVGKSLKLNVASDPSKVLYRQEIDLLGGHLYRASAWLRADSDTLLTLRVRKNSPFYTTWGQETLKIGREWVKFSFDVAPFENNLARFEFNVHDVGINVYVDNASLVEIPISTSLNGYSSNTGRNVPNTLFGMHINRGHLLDLWQSIEIVEPGLIRLTSTGTKWENLETSKGVYNWTRLIMYLDRIGKALPNSKVIYTFGRVPGWANSQQGHNYPPNDINDWQDFVTALVSRYGNRIDYYEVWNEFDQYQFWSGTHEQMLAMHKIVKQVVEEFDPTGIVLLPNITVYGMHRLGEYLRLGGGAYSDAASIHLYPGEDDIENLFIYSIAVRDLLRRVGFPNMPILNTEGAVVIPTTSAPSASEQRAYVARYFIMSVVAGLDTSAWYYWENTIETERLPLVSDSETFTTLTPAAISYQTLGQWLRGSRLERIQQDEATGLYEVEISQPDESRFFLLWTTKGELSYQIPDNVGRAVKRLDGSLSTVQGDSLTIGSEPIRLDAINAIPAPAMFRFQP